MIRIFASNSRACATSEHSTVCANEAVLLHGGANGVRIDAEQLHAVGHGGGVRGLGARLDDGHLTEGLVGTVQGQDRAATPLHHLHGARHDDDQARGAVARAPYVLAPRVDALRALACEEGDDFLVDPLEDVARAQQLMFDATRIGSHVGHL